MSQSDATRALTLDEQIGQMLMVGFPGTTPTPELTELIQQQHVGNIILFSRNVQSIQQLRELTEALQEIARAAGQRSLGCSHLFRILKACWGYQLRARSHLPFG